MRLFSKFSNRGSISKFLAIPFLLTAQIFFLNNFCHAEKCAYSLTDVELDPDFIESMHSHLIFEKYLGTFTRSLEGAVAASEAGYNDGPITGGFCEDPDIGIVYHQIFRKDNRSIEAAYAYYIYSGICPSIPEEDDLNFLKPADRNLGAKVSNPQKTCNQIIK